MLENPKITYDIGAIHTSNLYSLDKTDFLALRCY